MNKRVATESRVSISVKCREVCRSFWSRSKSLSIGGDDNYPLYTSCAPSYISHLFFFFIFLKRRQQSFSLSFLLLPYSFTKRPRFKQCPGYSRTLPRHTLRTRMHNANAYNPHGGLYLPSRIRQPSLARVFHYRRRRPSLPETDSREGKSGRGGDTRGWDFSSAFAPAIANNISPWE